MSLAGKSILSSSHQFKRNVSKFFYFQRVSFSVSVMWAATRANPLKVLEKNRRFSFVVCHFGMGQQSPRSGKQKQKKSPCVISIALLSWDQSTRKKKNVMSPIVFDVLTVKTKNCACLIKTSAAHVG